MKVPFQKPYEKIEIIIRRHKWVLVGNFIQFGFLFLLGFLVYYFADLYVDFDYYGIGELADFFLILYMLIMWQAFFVSIVDYFLDTWIITDHRVIDIHQISLFKRDVSELRYSKIQDVSVKIQGIIPTFLNFGDLIIQTAGAVQEFHFQQIPNPNQIRDKILHLHDQYMKEHLNDIEVHETLGDGTV